MTVPSAVLVALTTSPALSNASPFWYLTLVGPSMLSVYAFGFLVTDKVGCMASVAPVSEVTSLLPKRMSDLLSSPRASVIFFSVRRR